MALSAQYNELKERVKNSGLSQRSSQYNALKKNLQTGGISSDVDEAYINTFLQDSEAFMKKTKSDYEALTYSTAVSQEGKNPWETTSSDLATRAENIRTYLNANKGRLQEESYAALKKYLGDFSEFQTKSRNAFNDARQYYSQWKTEEEYNRSASGSETAGKKDSLQDMSVEELTEVGNNFQMYAQKYNAIQNGLTTGFQPGYIPYEKGSNEYWQEYQKQEKAYNEFIIRKYEEYQRKYGSVEDIKAQVDALTGKTDDRTWFQKGAYGEIDWENKSFGENIGQMVKGTTATNADVGENLVAGLMEFIEKAADGITLASQYAAQGQYYQNGGVYQPIQQQKAAEESFDAGKKWAAGVVQKDLINGEKIAKAPSSALGIDTDADSVLGEKSDSLVQSASQLAAQAGLNMVGVPWFLTSAATSFGGEAENALNEGASVDEAALSGVISASAEVLTEKLGGITFGGKPLTSELADALSKRISNKFCQKLVQFGLESVVFGEGTEEVVSEMISRFGQWLTYQDDKTLQEMFASEEATDAYIESYIGGFVLGEGNNVIKSLTGGEKQTGQQSESEGETPHPSPAVTPSPQGEGSVGRNATAPAGLRNDTAGDSNAYEDALALAKNADKGTLDFALAMYQQSGSVSNSQATAILNDPKAVQTLEEQTGMKLPGTASGNRAAVKLAVATFAQQEATSATQSADGNTDGSLPADSQGGADIFQEVSAMARGEDAAKPQSNIADDIIAMANGTYQPKNAAEVDTAQRTNYDNIINETEGGVIGNERREESRESFYRRANEEVRTVRERGKIACGYYPVADKTGRAGQTEKALQELGIPVIVHEGLEANVDGATRTIQGAASSVPGDVVYVRNTVETDPIETAGHEAYHFWKHTDARSIYTDTIIDNIDFSSDEFIQFQKDIAETYFGDEVGIDDDGADKLVEEIFAYITGLVHAGDPSGEVHGFLRDYDAVKAALDTLVEKQTKGQSPTQTEVNPGDSTTPNATDSVGAAPAKVLTETPKTERTRRNLWSRVKEGVFDKGMVFENLALKTKNRELQAKWNSTRYAQSRAQWLIGNGAENTKSLNAIREEVESTGKANQFGDYMYRRHNIDRMQLETRYKDTKNKPVFGDSVTAEVSQEIVNKYEKENPSFTQLADDVYSYMNHLRQLMVDNGVISQNTADLWAEMYPHYVPIHRAGKDGRSVDVPLDTGRTGVNAPVKKAKGGNDDILPLFDTMAQRTLQTYTAIARNSFGVELKNTLGSVVSKDATNVDEVIDSVDAQEGLLQEGKNGTNPTFTVFENGERVTFEVTKEMYDALKPKSEVMSYTIKVANAVSNFHRGVLTEYNPTFMLTNAIKDVQDVLINSQHPAKTYAKIPRAYVELAKKGKWYTEYVANGGDQNTYFNSETNTFETEDAGVKKLLDKPPLGTISKLNSFIEMAPRLAEYMASREAGKSIDVAMLDAARVTTNFAAGGDLTKLLDRNGATFLNASMQGVVQQARNIREAKANGWKGWVGLAVRFVLAGLPEALLNGLIWDDDEDYAELSDYVKDNYYILWKYDDGQFFKIPKGRVVAVIQGAVRWIIDSATGNDEADWGSLLELVGSNLAPNNPFESNIISPLKQVTENRTWYGEDLVPSRLQDLPVAEQYDESTDALSKWLGEKLNISPVKINYLLDQYGGGISDTILPMLTPKAESGDNSVVGKLLAPLKDKFTTDSVMNNQNVTDFYDKLDELTTKAKASNATVEDKIIYKYVNSVNSQLRDLYAEKRQVQSGDLPDNQKYAQVRSIQQKIADAAQKALEAIQNPYSADKSGMVAGVIGDSIADLTDCWKRGTDTAAAMAAIEQAYGAYAKMGNDGKAGVKAEGGRVADYLAARESGITTKTFADLYETYYSIDKGDGNASAKAAQWSYALEKAQEQGIITAAQKNTLKEEMSFWQMIPADTDRFDELTGGGLSADKADLVTEILGLLKPETGKTTVRTIQRVEAITAADDKLTEAEKKIALESVLDDSAYSKFLKVLELGMSTDDYSNSYRLFLDASGSGKKERTIAQYQQEFGVSYSTAKALYEIYSSTKS